MEVTVFNIPSPAGYSEPSPSSGLSTLTLDPVSAASSMLSGYPNQSAVGSSYFFVPTSAHLYLAVAAELYTYCSRELLSIESHDVNYILYLATVSTVSCCSKRFHCTTAYILPCCRRWYSISSIPRASTYR